MHSALQCCTHAMAECVHFGGDRIASVMGFSSSANVTNIQSTHKSFIFKAFCPFIKKKKVAKESLVYPHMGCSAFCFHKHQNIGVDDSLATQASLASMSIKTPVASLATQDSVLSLATWASTVPPAHSLGSLFYFGHHLLLGGTQSPSNQQT